MFAWQELSSCITRGGARKRTWMAAQNAEHEPGWGSDVASGALPGGDPDAAPVVGSGAAGVAGFAPPQPTSVKTRVQVP